MVGALVIFLLAPGLLLLVATVVYLVFGRAKSGGDDDPDAGV
jgi:hypothetical protein